jgi:phage terminase large subunit
MKIKTTVIYDYMEQAYNNRNPIVVHAGGSRSSKTYNILIWLIVKCLGEWQNKIIDIGRKTFPAVRTTVMFDLLTILREYGLYNEGDHDRSNNTYHLNNNLIRFFSVDQETKVRGSKRDFLFLNEANEFTEDDFKQLNMRTTTMTIMDYNPSALYHWIYDKILTRDDVAFYCTTFRDNPFLEQRIKDEIYSYKDKDPNYWRIYGLGLQGIATTTIFPNWDYVDAFTGEGEVYFGLDFGFNDPTALVRARVVGDSIVADELLHKSQLTSDLIIRELERLNERGILKRTDIIFGDSARPEIIQDIHRAGFNIRSVEKGSGSVLRDINFLKQHKLCVTKESVNLAKEVKHYSWKTDRDGKILDDPVDILNHCIDALRYSLNAVILRKQYPNPFIGKAKLYR